MRPMQLDFLEHPSVTDVVVCGVVLEEVGGAVRHQSLPQS